MKTLLVCLVFSLAADQVTLQEVRTAFFGAKSSAQISAFYDKAVKCTDSDRAVVVAYKGAATTMCASLTSGVSGKLDYFRKGKALIEQSVSKDSDNAEIRFVRFAVQAEAPAFLGYDDNLSSDGEFIVNYLANHKDQLQSYLWKNAVKFMTDSGELSDTQEARLNKLKKS